MCVCMFTYSSRWNGPIYIKLGMHIPCDRKENTGRTKHRRNILSPRRL
jgi:hypothetical protein